MNYKQEQQRLQIEKLKKFADHFDYDEGFGDFGDYRNLPFVLKDGKNNLYKGIVDQVIEYFEDNKIDFWGDNKNYPTGHLLSSQIQCLNFLFPLKNDKEAVLELVKLFDSDIEEVLPVIGDVNNQYIAFEFTYDNKLLLSENDLGATRGAYCTSVDAFIFTKRRDKIVLIPIEWKYTESYLKSENKALEYKKGLTRQSRYNQLIKRSSCLKDFEDLETSPYYYEPLYEFMRQTLLIEQMIRAGIADDYLHVIVVSPDNKELMGNKYSFSSDNLETIWHNCLKQPNKFKVIDTKRIFTVYEGKSLYSNILNYLSLRYCI